MKKIMTLCRGQGCCPELFIDFSDGTREDYSMGQYILEDDYDNKVIFLKEHFNTIIHDIDSIISNIDDLSEHTEYEIDFNINNKYVRMKPYQLAMLKESLNQIEEGCLCTHR